MMLLVNVIIVFMLNILDKKFTEGFWDFQFENNITYPGWTAHRYFINDDNAGNSSEIVGDYTIRTHVLQEQNLRSYLMCPQGFVISSIQSQFLMWSNKKNLSGFDDFTRETVHHWNPDNLVTHNSSCDSLDKCLLYQACVFNFGNEFCLRDPIPGERKNLLTNITCTKEDVLEEAMMEHDDYGQEVFDDFMLKKEKVLQITYKSRLGDLHLSPDEIKPEDTKFGLHDREEESVFGGSCPVNPYDHGYKGHCQPLNISSEEVVQQTWHLMSRMDRQQCRDEIMEIFCARQYCGDMRCIPPMLLDSSKSEVFYNSKMYPVRGPRPDDLWDTLEEAENSPIKVM